MFEGKPFQNIPMPFSLEILHKAYASNLYFRYLSDYMFNLGDDEWLYQLWAENPEVYEHLIIIGHNCEDPRLYALWKQFEGQSVEEMPVLMIDIQEDAEGQCVIANNINDFVRFFTIYGIVVLDCQIDYNNNFARNYTLDFIYYNEEKMDAPGAKEFAAFQEFFRQNLNYEPFTLDEMKNYLQIMQNAPIQATFREWIVQYPFD